MYGKTPPTDAHRASVGGVFLSFVLPVVPIK
jgi:hypothetical protein